MGFSDFSLAQNENFFSYNMERTSHVSMRWCPLCTNLASWIFIVLVHRNICPAGWNVVPLEHIILILDCVVYINV